MGHRSRAGGASGQADQPASRRLEEASAVRQRPWCGGGAQGGGLCLKRLLVAEAAPGRRRGLSDNGTGRGAGERGPGGRAVGRVEERHRTAVVVVWRRMDERRRQGKRRGTEEAGDTNKPKRHAREGVFICACVRGARGAATQRADLSACVCVCVCMCVCAERGRMYRGPSAHHHAPRIMCHLHTDPRPRAAVPRLDRPTPGPISGARGQSGASRKYLGTAVPPQDLPLTQGYLRVLKSVCTV